MKISLISLLVGVVCLSGCSKLRSFPAGVLTGTSGSPGASLSLYPHTPEDWTADHMETYLQVKDQGGRPANTCVACHETRPGKPLNISCGASCHAPREVAVAPQPGAHLGQPAAANACQGCHADHFTAPFAHQPAAMGMCKLCHQAKPEHLSGQDPKAVTTDRRLESCSRCHSSQGQGQVVHGAISMDGNCLNCHNAHGSKLAHLVSETAPNLCQNCHEQGTSDHAHPAVLDGKSCLSCHTPHSSARPKLLVNDQQPLCASCHQDVARQIQTGASVHEAVLTCADCHDAHGNGREKMLVADYPLKTYTEYKAEPNPYALCFGCHDTLMLEKGGETAFRAGVKNLHRVHVLNEGGTTGPRFGRSCYACHEPHASGQQRLIKGKIGVNQLPMSFERTPTGGRCGSSCHEPRSYLR